MIASLGRLLCPHFRTWLRVQGNRMYTECQSCGQPSEGIEVGTHRYSPETTARIQRTKEMNRAKETITSRL